MYFAFYAAQPPGKADGKSGNFHGEIELRGLADRTYHVVDYANDKDYGSMRGPVAKLAADFNRKFASGSNTGAVEAGRSELYWLKQESILNRSPKQ
jgi:hypothetical protein